MAARSEVFYFGAGVYPRIVLFLVDNSSFIKLVNERDFYKILFSDTIHQIGGGNPKTGIILKLTTELVLYDFTRSVDPLSFGIGETKGYGMSIHK